mgnify:CR=1 FL=1
MNTRERRRVNAEPHRSLRYRKCRAVTTAGRCLSWHALSGSPAAAVPGDFRKASQRIPGPAGWVLGESRINDRQECRAAVEVPGLWSPGLCRNMGVFIRKRCE